MHIMLIDDEKILSKHLKIKLENDGYEVSVLNSYKEFQQQKDFSQVSIFLIDVSLGDGSGIDIIKSLKSDKTTNNIPTIILSGHTEVSTKVRGLDAGSGDYIEKPFQYEELIARVRSNLRKYNPQIISNVLEFNGIVFDTIKRKVYIDSTEIPLSKKEKQILEFFISHNDVCISKDTLQKKFWKNFPEYSVPENTINATICHLRRKLGEKFTLKTIVGEGYTLSST